MLNAQQTGGPTGIPKDTRNTPRRVVPDLSHESMYRSLPGLLSLRRGTLASLIVHQPHEFTCSPLQKEGGLKLPNLKHDRSRHGRHVGLLPQLVAGLWLYGSPRSKDLSICISLNQEDLETSTQLMPRRVRRSRRNPWEANPQAFISRCMIQTAPSASLIEHRPPATAIDTHSRSYPG